MAKNNHDPQTPEWQLQQNAEGAESAARAYQADSERYLSLAHREREKAARYREALRILEKARTEG